MAADEAASTLDDFRVVLYGPPNLRTCNRGGMRDVVLRYLGYLAHCIRQQLRTAANKTQPTIVLSGDTAIDVAFSGNAVSFPVYPAEPARSR